MFLKISTMNITTTSSLTTASKQGKLIVRGAHENVFDFVPDFGQL